MRITQWGRAWHRPSRAALGPKTCPTNTSSLVFLGGRCRLARVCSIQPRQDSQFPVANIRGAGPPATSPLDLHQVNRHSSFSRSGTKCFARAIAQSSAKRLAPEQIRVLHRFGSLFDHACTGRCVDMRVRPWIVRRARDYSAWRNSARQVSLTAVLEPPDVRRKRASSLSA